MSGEIENTGTHCQHADDLGRDISNAILEWERRNPGAKVLSVTLEHNGDVMAPYLYITTKVERNICVHGKGMNDYCMPCGRVHGGG